MSLCSGHSGSRWQPRSPRRRPSQIERVHSRARHVPADAGAGPEPPPQAGNLSVTAGSFAYFKKKSSLAERLQEF